MKLKVNILLIFQILFSNITYSISNNELFEKANDYYSKKNYQNALEYYLKIEQNHFESEDLYYNIANTYYKLGEKAYSIAYYEKSLKLNPNNSNAIYNLQLLNSNIEDKYELPPTAFYFQWIKFFVGLFPEYEWTVYSLISLTLFFISISLYLLLKKITFKKIFFSTSLLFILLFTITTFFAQQNIKINQTNKYAIIKKNINTIYGEPNPNSLKLFVLHQGTKVELTGNEQNEWIEIKFSHNKVGWLLAQNLIKI